MTTATAAKQARLALTDEYVALALAKLGLDVTDAASVKEINKKTPADMASAIGRLRAMRDFNAAPAAPEAATWAPEPERTNNGGGNGARKPAAPKGPQKLIDFAASLLREVWADDTATADELIADLVRYDGDHLSRMIDNLKTQIPITEGQVRFANSLFAQKFGTTGAAEFAASLDQYSKSEAKALLDSMQNLPDYVAPTGERAARKGPEVEADGMYRDPATGDIYKVQVALHGSGKLYAKKLVRLEEPTIVRGKEAHFAFEMARGAIMNIKPEWRLTREDAKEFGDLYGCCMRCGTTLTDERSIETGLGSTCRTKM